jgi:hypothetical protein
MFTGPATALFQPQPTRLLGLLERLEPLPQFGQLLSAMGYMSTLAMAVFWQLQQTP